MIASRIRLTAPVPSVAFVTVQGRLDMDSSRQVQETCRQALAMPAVKWLVFHLGGADFIDSTGLATLVSVRAQLQRRGGGVALARPTDQVLRTIALAGEEGRFSVFSSEGEALQTLLR